MAKRNSTKTATKEAQAASEPRILNFGQWVGINIKEAPLGFNPLEPAYTHKTAESDLPDNFLALQNNVVTTSLKALETRLDTLPVCEVPDASLRFSGVVHLHENKLFCSFKSDEETDDQLYYYELLNDEAGDELPYSEEHWHHLPVDDKDRIEDRALEITCIYVYAGTLIVLTRYQGENLGENQGKGEIFLGQMNALDEGVSSSKLVGDPTEEVAELLPMGELSQDDSAAPVCRITVKFCYTNRFGSTLPSKPATKNLNYSPVEFNGNRYLAISGKIDEAHQNSGITGVDLYCAMNESQDYIFIGHAAVAEDAQDWYFNWFGAMNDTSQWTSVQLTVPTANETKGVDACYVRCHDGRLYFYGGSEKNRLYIGGDPGAELSCARGLGGAFVDLDPGTGLEIQSTHKFKTYNGASIVTIMCGNKNTNAIKRFNLLETNLTVTNELQSKGYEAEEVPNVIGCNSQWGAGVWEDGLYALSRYGLAITTMQMEESNTLKVQYLSDNIQPIFTERMSSLLKNCRMMYCDGVVYFALAVPDQDNDDNGHDETHTGLDRIIFCYDINQKAWYTLSYERLDGKEILHLFNFDYEGWWEGIGLVTENRIDRIPVTGPHSEQPPKFTALIETGELGLRVPPQIYVWLAQLELRFDYIVGDLDIEIWGTDYYGREYKVYKSVSTKGEDGKYKLLREYPVWIRIDKNVETYRMRIKGNAHFRMTHFMSKTYQQSDKMALVYGYDAHVNYMGRHGELVDDHHYLDSYNNLRKAIVP